ncbi:unnamed protein product [Linum trigynum]|uniref:non-specific serine/threonine protein kinase n=1 Tax=Linum trigynum TaxID=586398 RepID=A0AAV2D9E8_9ROSI
MGLLRTIRRYLYGILNYPRRNEVGGNFGMSFETPDLFISLRTLQVATNFFSKKNVIGQGGFGRVYKGLMPNGQEIAVKKLSSNSTPGVIEFTNEVKLLSEIRHLNLVTLLGCCVEGSDKMLVYEYLPNKSLDCFLFDKEKSSSLDWTTRFNIAKGVARGIPYLHEEAPMKILHRDIKASNILLDESLNPKISDFGLARLCPEEDSLMSTRVSGTHGYMAPEYAMHGYLSVKTDVFSYGILLLEIISGRRSLDRRLSTDHADLANFAWTLYQAGKMLELVDPALGDHYNTDSVGMCIQIGLLCCQQTVADRPDMNSIHLMLSSDSFTLLEPGKPGGRWTSMKSGVRNSINTLEDHFRNSSSFSSFDEGS